MLQLKGYQSRALKALKDYFSACNNIGSADTAFYETTGKWIGQKLPYQNVSQMSGLPYVCIRIPTGGGKTLVACHAAGIAKRNCWGPTEAFCYGLSRQTPLKNKQLRH